MCSLTGCCPAGQVADGSIFRFVESQTPLYVRLRLMLALCTLGSWVHPVSAERSLDDLRHFP